MRIVLVVWAVVMGFNQLLLGGGVEVDVLGSQKSCGDKINLDGKWHFKIDEDNCGEKLNWHKGDGDFDIVVKVPGVPQAQGVGDENDMQRNYFFDPFWVRRNFKINKIGPGKRVWLKIGGIFPAGRVYINGQMVGYTKSSRTALKVDVTEFIKSGGENLIAIKICDLPQVRLDGLWEGFYKNWSGLYRSICLEVTEKVCFDDFYVLPMVDEKKVKVEIKLCEAVSENTEIEFVIKDGWRKAASKKINLAKGQRCFETEIGFEDFEFWSLEKPKLYKLCGKIKGGDEFEVSFGMRKMEVDGSKFYLNGEPVFLKAFGDDHYYPDTLMPVCDRKWYVEKLKQAKRYGFNAVKSCSDVVTEEYMQAADEVGVMVIQEMPFGLGDLRENKNDIGQRFKDYYTKELENIVRFSRNHASVIFYSITSELNYWRQTKQSFEFFNRALVERVRQLDRDSIVTDGTGYIIEKQTKFGLRDTDFSSKGHVFRDVFDEVEVKREDAYLQPIVLHEYNWWSSYPDPAKRGKYLKSQYKPFWYEQLYESARKNGQEDLIGTYYENSVWLQKICRKEGIEYARRAGLEGYILWLLIDLNQYCEGLLDDWWEEKNVTAEEFLRCNGDTVIIVGEDKGRCFKAGDVIKVPLAVSHYGRWEIKNCEIKWRVSIKGKKIESGVLAVGELAKGKLNRAGEVIFTLPNCDGSYKFKLEVEVESCGEKINSNSWDFWAFGEVKSEYANLLDRDDSYSGILGRFGDFKGEEIFNNAKVVVTDIVDGKLVEYLKNGGRCVLLSHGSMIENDRADCKFFRTIPWNRGVSGNSGTVIAEHEVMEDFVHEGKCGLQFVDLIKDIYPMEIDGLREYGVRPIIRVIDHYKSNRNKAYMLEFKVSRGKVLVTSLAIRKKFETNIEARYLLQCMVDYAKSERFEPDSSVPVDVFLKCFEEKLQQ